MWDFLKRLWTALNTPAQRPTQPRERWADTFGGGEWADTFGGDIDWNKH